MRQHKKAHKASIQKEFLKKSITTALLLFFAMLMIFPKDTANTELQFVWNSDTDTTHNAANDNPPAGQRDYLFQNVEGNPQLQNQVTKGQDTQITPPSTTNSNTILYPDTTHQTNSEAGMQNTNTGIIYSGVINAALIATGTNTVGKDSFPNDTIDTSTGISVTGDCITPWKENVKNHDFVLAYEQREDVNTICNVEKRVCNDGILGGSFAQSSCKENVVYEYTKEEVISYNQKVLNEYIQPSAPVNSGATFNNQGKIDTLEKPTIRRGTANSTITTNNKPVIAQAPFPVKANCTTPRGQTIQHGQFIKAYKAPRGFTDLACDVEIRPCTNGTLRGTFNYPKCTFNNTTYSDYLKAGAPLENTGFIFFQWIKSLVKGK